MSVIIKQREYAPNPVLSNLPALLARLYATRGVQSVDAVSCELKQLLPYHSLKNITQAADVLADAITQRQHILIVGDFDADGATSTALAVRVLREFGAAKVSYLVPNRFEYGYGLTPEIVEVAAKQSPNLIMTVDNGISSIEGVQRAKALGIEVLITDHHLAGEQLPEAVAIVNPNQPGDEFPSKHLAGVGVCFYVMLATRQTLRARGWFEQQGMPAPNMATYLDIVALGTVADVVPLDHTNRILVYQGLRRIRADRCAPGIKAILQVAKRLLFKVSSSDLGFAVGPRLNAAGRLDDMSLGIECLLADDDSKAQQFAEQLDTLNKERRAIEDSMKQEAMSSLEKIDLRENALPRGLCLYDATWHQGVIGILASRIKDKYHRPVIVFADAGDGEIKGSARSVEGVHIRDVLDAIAKQYPTLIAKFGGHAMAAGLSIAQADYATFAKVFSDEVSKHLSEEQLHGELLSDGALSESELVLATAELLQDAGPWGQQFPEPLFDNVFTIIEQRLVGEKHLRLRLQHPNGGKVITAIQFFTDLNQWPNHRCEQVRAAYRLDINEYNGVFSLQLIISALEPN